MKEKVLIVEDQFVEADYLRLMLTRASYQVTGIAHSVIEAQKQIEQEKPDFVLLDIFLKGKLTGIDLAKQLSEQNIAFVYLSANSNEEILNQAKATQPYGFLVKPFREKDLLITLEIARYRHEHSLDTNIRREHILIDKLSAIIDSPETREIKLLSVCKTIQPYIPFHYVTAGFNEIADGSSRAISFLRIGYDEYQQIGVPELLNITGLKLKELVTIVQNTNSGAEPSLDKLFSQTFQMSSSISLLLQLSNGHDFNFCFYSRITDNYNADHTGLLSRLQKMLSGAIERMSDEGKSKISNGSRNNDSRIISNGAFTNMGFEGIIGKSHLLLNVFDLVTRVAPSDTSVLIMGESGTGKERIAECIHHLSPRANKPLVKVNCAALPANLIESELFGHEKGSFTGAIDKRIGKFEKADKGTIFLDEIGEMPPDLQVKLLRVLQEKYIERIGSRDITRVDVRIVAATNRNLEKEVAEGRFRLDLYYRLNVFPIELPPLRERIEDIPALADHFIQYYNRKTGKKITGLSDKVLKSMTLYDWPGNIRELENLIERSLLLTKGNIIESISIPLGRRMDNTIGTVESPMKTIFENERDYIITVLKKCNGRIWGVGGAAEILNIPPTTLTSKMKKLGIRKEYIE